MEYKNLNEPITSVLTLLHGSTCNNDFSRNTVLCIRDMLWLKWRHVKLVDFLNIRHRGESFWNQFKNSQHVAEHRIAQKI